MKKLFLGALLGFAALLQVGSAGAVTYNAAADFSAVSNPNGSWSYGYSSALGGVFTGFASTTANLFGIVTPGVSVWGVAPGVAPMVFENTTASPLVAVTSINIASGQLALHPGSLGEFAVVRWTAANAGSVLLSSVFSGIDLYGGSTDVHVLLNGVSIFNSFNNGIGAISSFASTLSVFQGSTIDFVVGYGQNLNFFNDATGLLANITTVAVPEPSFLLLFGIALVGLFAFRRKSFF